MEDDLVVIVGVPTYNNEDTIRPTLGQLFAQSRSPDKIIVCDNSTDRTPEIVREMTQGERIPVELLFQSGDGVAAAYNQMWRHEYPHFDMFVTIQTNLVIDEDWLAGHIEAHCTHPEVGIVTGINGEACREVKPDELQYYQGRNISFKREALEAIEGWDPNFLRGEDWDMRIRLAGAGIRGYTCPGLAHRWMDERSDLNPYITLAKARRRPTAVTFLAKYGPWYIRFHPTHILHDLLSVTGLVFGIGTLLMLPVSPILAVGMFFLFLVSVMIYTVGHLVLRGTVDGGRLLGPVRKQLLNGIAVFYALRRMAAGPEWNRAGFEQEAIPRFGF